jgi:hypothetical protein
MDTVWIRTQDNVLIRADSIMILESDHEGLRAECITGRTVQLTRGACSTASQLALLEEIRHAGVDDRRAVVIMPVRELDSLVWHRECADTLIDQLSEHENRVRELEATPVPRGRAG